MSKNTASASSNNCTVEPLNLALNCTKLGVFLRKNLRQKYLVEMNFECHWLFNFPGPHLLLPTSAERFIKVYHGNHLLLFRFDELLFGVQGISLRQ